MGPNRAMERTHKNDHNGRNKQGGNPQADITNNWLKIGPGAAHVNPWCGIEVDRLQVVAPASHVLLVNGLQKPEGQDSDFDLDHFLSLDHAQFKLPRPHTYTIRKTKTVVILVVSFLREAAMNGSPKKYIPKT